MGLEPSAILGKRQNKHKRELWIQRFPTVIVLEDVSIFVPHCAPRNSYSSMALSIRLSYVQFHNVFFEAHQTL